MFLLQYFSCISVLQVAVHQNSKDDRSNLRSRFLMSRTANDTAALYHSCWPFALLCIGQVFRQLFLLLMTPPVPLFSTRFHLFIFPLLGLIRFWCVVAFLAAFLTLCAFLSSCVQGFMPHHGCLSGLSSWTGLIVSSYSFRYLPPAQANSATNGHMWDHPFLWLWTCSPEKPN